MRDAKIPEIAIPDFTKFQQAFQKARSQFIPQEGILGVGHGVKQAGGVASRVYSIIVFVVKKQRDKGKIKPDAFVDREFDGAGTDVVEIGERKDPVAAAHDRTFIEPGKRARPKASSEGRRARKKRKAVKVGETAVVFYDDGSDSKVTDAIDRPIAYQCFREGWEDDTFDFVTFFVDSPSGLPAEGTFHYGVYNDTEGIGYDLQGTQASPFSRRAEFGSSRLLACNFVDISNWEQPEALLHEAAHMWTAYVHFKVKRNAYDYLSLLLRQGAVGGQSHWGTLFQDDQSPMDYDDPPVCWEKDNNNHYRQKSMTVDDFRFCDLDLYLMGLIPPAEVRPFITLRKPLLFGGDFHVKDKELTAHNIELAHGKRVPGWDGCNASSPKVFRHAFVLLTKREGDSAELRAMAKRIDHTRERFVEMFSRATGGRAKMDTRLDGSADSGAPTV